MEKSKTWIKDRFNVHSFSVGDTVFLVRKKQNGYPKNLSFDKEYVVVGIENQDLFIEEEGLDIWALQPPHQRLKVNVGRKLKRKCHFSYFIKKSSYREAVIRDILGN